jgi:plastocyanin
MQTRVPSVIPSISGAPARALRGGGGMMRRAALVLVAALVLAGCGGGSSDGLPDADIALLGTDRLTWEPSSVRVQPGTLSVAIVCERGANHNLVIEETGEEIAACAPGRTAFGEVTLEPGNYTMVCTVPGHEVTMRAALAVAVR